MAEINAAIVKELRERTGSGMMDCKKALAESGGDMEKAIDYLREKGLAKAAKKADRAASDGRVFQYIHTNFKVGALLELNSETDFVAKTDEFNHLGHEICMQIAAANPQYVRPEDVPEDVLQQLLEEGKPAQAIDKILEGKVRKFYETSCLLEQEYIRDSNKKIKDLVTDMIAKLGENIVVKRFARFSIGE